MQKKVKLGDIATLITKGTTPTSIGYSFVDSGVNFIKIESLNDQGRFIPEKFAFISEDCNAKMQRSQLHENDILFSIAGAIGKKAVVSNNILPANTNQALAIIRIPKGKINHQYLFYALESDGIKKQFEKQKQGVAQLNLSLKDISEIEINLVSQEEQDKTVAVIGNVDKLIDKRKQQLQKLDELVKARFVEMFGDEFSEFNKLGNLASVTGGLTKNSKRKDLELKLPYLRVANVYFNKIDTKEILEIGLTEEEYKKTVLEYGDLLFVEGNGSPEQIGRVAVWRDEVVNCVHQNHIIKARFDKCVMQPMFVMHYFMSVQGREQIKSKAVSTSGLHTLSVSKISDLDVPIVEIALQNKFVYFVEQINKSKLSVQNSLDKLETLKKALMQKYFG